MGENKINWANDYCVNETIKELKNQISGTLSRLRQSEREQKNPNENLMEQWNKRAIEIRDILVINFDWKTKQEADAFIKELSDELKELLAEEQKRKQ